MLALALRMHGPTEAPRHTLAHRTLPSSSRLDRGAMQRVAVVAHGAPTGCLVCFPHPRVTGDWHGTARRLAVRGYCIMPGKRTQIPCEGSPPRTWA